MPFPASFTAEKHGVPRSTLLGMLAAGLLAALLFPTPALAAKRTAPAGAFFGVNAQILLNQYGRAAWQAPLDTAAGLGITAIRNDAPWSRAEPAPPRNGRHTFHWEWFDAVAEDLAKRGMRWVPILDYSAPWAASFLGNFLSPPRDPEEFATYARAFAGRYGRGGAFWREHPGLPRLPVVAYEVWNEPNLPQFWVPYPSAARYAELYLTTRAALRDVDPSATAIVGGLSASGGDSATGYLREMHTARPDLTGRIDAVGLHPYEGSPQAVAARVVAFRAALDRLGGVDVPIVVNEFGWTTGGLQTLGSEGISDAIRADLLVRTSELLARSDCGVGGAMPHTLVTRESNRMDPEEWYGIVSPLGVPHASARAYGGAVARLDAVAAGGPVDTALCHRALSLALDRAPSPSRPKRSRARCHVARVRLAGVATAGATVVFAYRHHHVGRLRKLVRETDRNGIARACTRPRLLHVTASRPDVLDAMTVSPRSSPRRPRSAGATTPIAAAANRRSEPRRGRGLRR
jgi:hypothetical protein